MDSKEYTEIEASARELVRRAYDLGRSEALKRAVEVLSAERPSADQLVLMAPAQTEAEAVPTVPGPAMNGAASQGKTPWWAWRVR